MAAEPIDPRHFEIWEEAFQHPIAAVRKFETQLRNHAEENKQKLRGLVGASYRDLLNTADRIISMDEDMHKVEAILGTAGQYCNSRAIEKIFTNHQNLKKSQNDLLRNRYGLTAEVLLLQSATTLVARIVASGKSHLVAAKLLVLSRLIHKTLSARSDAPPIISNLRKRLVGIRRKLLKSIDKNLARVELEVYDLVEEMCALSLATSSTPTDVQRHFLHVRVEAITRLLKVNEHESKNIVEAMKVYLFTLRHTHQIFPKRLAEGLSKLKLAPLIQQRDVRAISELDLAVHEPWISDELRNYTPWPRHDELKIYDAQQQLRVWAQSALEAFIKGVKAALGSQNNIKMLMQTRREILEAWPWYASHRLPGLEDPSGVVDDLRETLNAQLVRAVRESVSKLDHIPEAISEILSAGNLQAAVRSFWSGEIISSDFSGGADSFKRTILNVYHGGSDITEAITALYTNWMTNVSSIREDIKMMKELRWDELSAADDEEDIELDDKQRLFSEDDPRILEQALESFLDTSFQRFDNRLLDIVKSLGSSDEVATPAAMFLLRVLRNIHGQAEMNRHITQPSLSSNIIRPLQQQLSAHVLSPALSVYRRAANREASASTLPPRLLWEGLPPLPVQPSPSAFRILKKLTAHMASVGSDLWSPGAVNTLKDMCERELGTILADIVKLIRAGPKEAHELPTTNGEPMTLEDGEENTLETGGLPGTSAITADEAPSSSKAEEDNRVNQKPLEFEKLVQVSFDALYLRRALLTIPSADFSGTALEGTIAQLFNSTNLDEVAQTRLHKSAAEYWKRTYLLFGMLT